MEEYK
jgi:diacylglycerol O-acyltransferase